MTPFALASKFTTVCDYTYFSYVQQNERMGDKNLFFHAKFGTLKSKRNGLSNCAVLDVVTGRRNKISLHMISEGGENVVSIRFSFFLEVLCLCLCLCSCLRLWLCLCPCNASRIGVDRTKRVKSKRRMCVTSKYRPAERAGREEK